MYSFNSEANSSHQGHEAAYSQSPPSTNSKHFQQRQEPLGENLNDILTPNFNHFPSSMGSENLFDAYHHQFAERSNQLSKLISTFEGLGLDIEYLEESEGQSAQHSEEQHSPSPQLAKVLSIDQQLDRAQPMISTVSRLPNPSFFKRQRQHMDPLKLNCKSLRKQLASFLLSLQTFQKQIKNIFASAQGYFTKFLTRFYQAVEASYSSCAKCLNLQGDCQYLQKDNAQLYRISAAREDQIRMLLNEKDQLMGENEKLHNELETITRKHRSCQELAKENKELQRLLASSSTKTNSLELQINHLTSKEEQLKRRLKDLQKQSQINYQHQKIKEGLERKYENMFNQSCEKTTCQIEVEEHYRPKHEYPLKEFHLRPAETQEKMNYSSHYGNTLEPISRSQTYQPNVPSYEKQLSMKRINSESRHSISIYREDSCYYSNVSTSIAEDERKVDRILEDIRQMKSSRDPPSMHSSCLYLELAHSHTFL